MIRSTKHILKYQTKTKTNLLNISIDLLRKQVEYYIDLMCSGQLSIKKFLSSKDLPNKDIEHSRWKQVCYKTASEILRSQYKKATNKRYKVYKKLYTKCLDKEGNSKHSRFTNKKFSELNLKSIYVSKYFKKPNLDNFSLNIDNRFFDIRNTNGEFDSFIKLILPIFNDKHTRSVNIKIPFKYYRLNNIKYNSYNDWILCNTIRLNVKDNQLFLELIYEKDETKLKNDGNIIGLDLGYKKLAILSNNKYIGVELEKIINKIINKKKASKSYKKCLIERTEYINKELKSIDFNSIKELVIEDLKNVKYRSKLNHKVNNKLNYWTYSYAISKLESLCQENGVQLTKVDPAYTSQMCSNCGAIHKESRKREVYKCIDCGNEMDADLNASINLSRMGKYGSHNHEKQLLEKIDNRNFH